MKVLECSSKGDKRFSALYAEVDFGGRVTSIERHYQSSKGFDVKPKKVKGKAPDFVIIPIDEYNSVKLKPIALTPYYKMLWLMYLDANPELVEYAAEYDDYNDIFKGASINCQADVIRQYIKEGRESVYNDCKDLIAVIKKCQFEK